MSVGWGIFVLEPLWTSRALISHTDLKRTGFGSRIAAHWEPVLRFNSLSTAFLGNPRRTAPVHFTHVQWRRFYPKWHSDWDARCKYLLCICLLVSLCFLFHSFFPFGWHIPIFCFIAWRRRQKYVVLEVTSMLSSSHYLLFSQGQWLRGDSGQQSKHLRTGYWA